MHESNIHSMEQRGETKHDYYGEYLPESAIKNHLIICCLVHMLPGDRKRILPANDSSHDFVANPESIRRV